MYIIYIMYVYIAFILLWSAYCTCNCPTWPTPSGCIHIQMQPYISNRSVSHMGNHQSNLIGKRVYSLNYLNLSVSVCVCVCVCGVCSWSCRALYNAAWSPIVCWMHKAMSWAKLSWAELSQTNPSAAQSGVKITLTVSHICTVCTPYNQPIIMLSLSSLLLLFICTFCSFIILPLWRQFRNRQGGKAERRERGRNCANYSTVAIFNAS